MVELGHVYIDSSIVVRRTLQEPGALQHFSFKSAISSELLEVEVMRTLTNRHIAKVMTQENWLDVYLTVQKNLAGIQLIPLEKVVLERAMSSFPTVVSTLDAIHLATALLWAETTPAPLTFLTHDRQLGIAAVACRLNVYPEPVRRV